MAEKGTIVDSFESLLCELEHLWVKPRGVRLRAHPGGNLYLAPEGEQTRRALKGGSSWLLRGWYGPRFVVGRMRNTIRPALFSGEFEVGASIPEDAMIKTRWNGEVGIVASVNEGLVVKVARTDVHKRHLSAELKAYDRAREAGISRLPW